jgi:hypothetical protein
VNITLLKNAYAREVPVKTKRLLAASKAPVEQKARGLVTGACSWRSLVTGACSGRSLVTGACSGLSPVTGVLSLRPSFRSYTDVVQVAVLVLIF